MAIFDAQPITGCLPEITTRSPSQSAPVLQRAGSKTRLEWLTDTIGDPQKTNIQGQTRKYISCCKASILIYYVHFILRSNTDKFGTL